MQKVQVPPGAASPEQSAAVAQAQGQQQHASPNPQHQSPFTNSPNPNVMYNPAGQMTPMMQMQMQMGGMPLNAQQYGHQQTMHQSVMRHPSPGPPGGGQQGFMGMGMGAPAPY